MLILIGLNLFVSSFMNANPHPVQRYNLKVYQKPVFSSKCYSFMNLSEAETFTKGLSNTMTVIDKDLK